MAMAGVVVSTKEEDTRVETSTLHMLVVVLAVGVFNLDAAVVALVRAEAVVALVQAEVASPVTTTGQISSRVNKKVARLEIGMIWEVLISKIIVEVMCPIFVVVLMHIVSEIILDMLGTIVGGSIVETII
jgi:hypothetical protein